MKNSPQKKWCDMTPAEQARKRVRIEKEVKRQRREFHNSQSQRIVRAFADKRTVGFEEHVRDVAIFCLTRRGQALPPHLLPDVAIKAFQEADATFFRDLAQAIEHFKEEGLSKSSPPTPRLVIAENLDRWKYEKAKITVRLAEIEEATGEKISQSRYYAIIEQDGLKST